MPRPRAGRWRRRQRERPRKCDWPRASSAQGSQCQLHSGLWPPCRWLRGQAPRYLGARGPPQLLQHERSMRFVSSQAVHSQCTFDISRVMLQLLHRGRPDRFGSSQAMHVHRASSAAAIASPALLAESPPPAIAPLVASFVAAPPTLPPLAAVALAPPSAPAVPDAQVAATSDGSVALGAGLGRPVARSGATPGGALLEIAAGVARPAGAGLASAGAAAGFALAAAGAATGRLRPICSSWISRFTCASTESKSASSSSESMEAAARSSSARAEACAAAVAPPGSGALLCGGLRRTGGQLLGARRHSSPKLTSATAAPAVAPSRLGPNLFPPMAEAGLPHQRAHAVFEPRAERTGRVVGPARGLELRPPRR